MAKIYNRDFPHHYSKVAQARAYGCVRRPKLSGFASLAEAEEVATSAFLINRITHPFPSYTGFLVELQEALYSIGRMLPKATDVDLEALYSRVYYANTK